MNRLSLTILLLLLPFIVAVSCDAQTTGKNNVPSAYPGDYRTAENRVIGIDLYVTEDTHESRLIYSDYATGVVRLMSAISDGEFSIGPEFNVSSPVELKIRFLRNGEGAVTGLAVAHPSESERVAERIPLRQEDVRFQSGKLTLSGTLLTPATKGPHAGIILLHGSGDLTRYSFGPYPHFFTSLGFAVLVYDKRGTGESNGNLDLERTYYPNSLVDDAQAAFHFLQSNKNVDPKKIGFWGSSEGGMLTTQVAARTPDVAFIINSSGFMMPLWQQGLYNTEAGMRGEGYSRSDIDKAVSYEKLIIQVGRTGTGWEQFQKSQQEVRTEKWFRDYSIYLSSMEAVRRRWTHILSFTPLPALEKIKCPVLGLFGEVDTSTPASIAVSNMTHGLTKGGNQDYSLKIFPNATHSLMVGQKMMAPGVFPTLSDWLSQRFHAAD